MNRIVIAAVTAATMLAGAEAACAGAPLCYKPIHSGSGYSGTLAPLNDGKVPANGSAYNTAAEVHDYPGSAVFALSFDKPVQIGDILASVDNNDEYRFAFFDFSKGGGGTNSPKLTVSIAPTDGVVKPVPGGMETFSSFATPGATMPKGLKFAPVTATTVLVYSAGGDKRFAVGEVQLFAPGAAGSQKPGKCAP